MKYKTFEEWLEHLKEKNPNHQWETMDLTELKETYKDAKEQDNGKVQ